jgi:hypothetical protein
MSALLPGDNHSLQLFAQGGTAKINALIVYELRPAWKTATTKP